MRISLSVTPVAFCAGVEGEIAKKHPRSTPSPKTYFGVSFFISLSVLKSGPWRRNFRYVLCSLVLGGCQCVWRLFGVHRSVAVSVEMMTGTESDTDRRHL